MQKNLLIVIYPILMHFVGNLWLYKKSAASIGEVKSAVAANFAALQKLATDASGKIVEKLQNAVNQTTTLKSVFGSKGGTRKRRTSQKKTNRRTK